MTKDQLVMHLMQTAARKTAKPSQTFAVLMAATLTYCKACGMSDDDIISAVKAASKETTDSGEALLKFAKEHKNA